jgi:hypothetical protein
MDEVMAESDVVPVPVASTELVFRPIEPPDREAVKLLHEEWFPVRSVAPTR